MPTQYIADQKPYVRDYHEILHMIEYAQTEEQFRNIQERLNEYHRRHRYSVKGWWVFSYTLENKAAHSAWNSLQHLLLHRMNEVYDSSGTFGK